MSQKIFGSGVPVTVPGEKLTPDDMRWVTEDDWADIQSLARRYCRTVDATRSRKRMDGSATVSHHGHAPYGTDDISDDVTQDAFLIFAQRQREIMTKHVIASVDIDTRLPDSWQYVRRDGQTMMATRQTLMRWAVRDAAARNGYRVDIPPDEVDDTPDSQVMRGVRRVDHVARAAAVAASASQQSEAIWRMAYGDGSDFPTLERFLFVASQADDLGRAGVYATVAQGLHGGVYGSRSKVIRTRDAAAGEWGVLCSRLDEVREELIYQSERSKDTM